MDGISSNRAATALRLGADCNRYGGYSRAIWGGHRGYILGCLDTLRDGRALDLAEGWNERVRGEKGGGFGMEEEEKNGGREGGRNKDVHVWDTSK